MAGKAEECGFQAGNAWDDLADYIYGKISDDFPKGKRFTLLDHITTNLDVCGCMLVQASCIRDPRYKYRYYQKADDALATVKLLIRLALRKGFINAHEKEVCTRKLALLGKLIGGILRAMPQG
jgi:hypothetical protein